MTLDLVFPVLGTSVATDHAYELYGALSRVVAGFHAEESPLRFAPITGQAVPGGQLRIAEYSVLRVRLADLDVALALPLAGKKLMVGESNVRLGVPSVTR